MAARPMDLKPIFDAAFFVTSSHAGTRGVEDAQQYFIDETGGGGLMFEWVVPGDPDEDWLTDRLARLLYDCEARGIPIPECPGAFVVLFFAGQLNAVSARNVVAVSCRLLGVATEDAAARYGTGELHRGASRTSAI